MPPLNNQTNISNTSLTDSSSLFPKSQYDYLQDILYHLTTYCGCASDRLKLMNHDNRHIIHFLEPFIIVNEHPSFNTQGYSLPSVAFFEFDDNNTIHLYVGNDNGYDFTNPNIHKKAHAPIPNYLENTSIEQRRNDNFAHFVALLTQ